MNIQNRERASDSTGTQCDTNPLPHKHLQCECVRGHRGNRNVLSFLAVVFDPWINGE